MKNPFLDDIEILSADYLKIPPNLREVKLKFRNIPLTFTYPDTFPQGGHFDDKGFGNLNKLGINIFQQNGLVYAIDKASKDWKIKKELKAAGLSDDQINTAIKI